MKIRSLPLFSDGQSSADVRASTVEWLYGGDLDLPPGYMKLSNRPEVVAVVDKIASLIATETIKVMENIYDDNGKKIGDKKVSNALAAKLDQYPNQYLTRSAFIKNLIHTLYLEGDGNAIVMVDIAKGSLTDYLDDKRSGNENYINDLIPIEPSRVSIQKTNREDKINAPYFIQIDGKKFHPSDVLHFRIGANPNFPFKGKGPKTALLTTTENIGRIDAIQKEYLTNAYFPSFVVKYNISGGNSAAGRMMDELFKRWNAKKKAGQIINIPILDADIQQVNPMSLSDLAVKDTKEINNKTIASLLGVPLFLIDGSIKFDVEEYNSFIKSVIVPLSEMISQEMTNKLVVKDRQFIKLDYSKLYKHDAEEINMYRNLAAVGAINNNELRDRLGFAPSEAEGMNDFVKLENYIPINKLGEQKKLVNIDDDNNTSDDK